MADGGIRRAPYSTARIFAEWAVDLWPYVNGKAILSGVDLLSLDVASMVDVIHYLFESDAESILTGEQAEARDALRTYLYSELYGREYKYSSPKSRSGVTGQIDDPLGEDDFYDDMPKPVDPFERSGGVRQDVKPYVKPTSFDPASSRPFGNVLDAPLG